MRAWIDSAFAEQQNHQRAKPQGLEDWGLPLHPEMAMELYQVWVMSNYVALPFEGSWLAQPWYIRKAFLTLMKVEQWHKWNAGLPETEGLPNLENA